jgi:hypothetical protein
MAMLRPNSVLPLGTVTEGSGGGLTQLVADLRYSSLLHNHNLVYAPLNHTHDYQPAGNYALANHNHDSAYAPLNHTHAGVYATADHNHDASYAPIAQAVPATGTTGHVLTKQASGHAWAAPQAGGSSPWTMVKATADLAKINNAVLANDATLTIALTAGTRYSIRGMIWIDTTATGDFKYTFVGPAATLIRMSRLHGAAGAAPAMQAADAAYPAAAGVPVAGTGTTGGVVQFDAMILVGASGGTFAFQHAQNTATNDTGAIRRAGSWLEYATF